MSHSRKVETQSLVRGIQRLCGGPSTKERPSFGVLLGREVGLTQRQRIEPKPPAPPKAKAKRKTTSEPLSSAADELLRALEERGVPSGAWLIDIARARHALQEADSILRRLEDAIIRAARTSPLDQR